MIKGSKHTKSSIQKNRDAHKGKRPSNFKGRTRHSYGYILIYAPLHPYCGVKKCVYEHRLIIEAILGRFLSPDEDVHHLGRRDDNRPHKLMAFSSHSAHIRFEHGSCIEDIEIIFDGRIITREGKNGKQRDGSCGNKD